MRYYYRAWMEVVVACFELLSQNLLEERRKPLKSIRQNSWYLGPNANPSAPKYSSVGIDSGYVAHCIQ
jgi:hypothetical protein